MRNGTLYFLRPIGQQGPVKIGCSKHPPKRLMAFMSWSPVPLELVATAPGNTSLERRLHGIFAHQHSHLEWFHASKQLTELTAELAAGIPLDQLIDLNAAIKPFGKLPKRPPCSDDRRLYLKCSARLRIAHNRAQAAGVRFFVPADINRAMDRWANRRSRPSITPTPKELERIEALVAPFGLHIPFQDRAA